MSARPVYLRTLYPFASHYHAVDKGRLHYVDEGRGDAILCLHGNPTWSFAWRNLIQDMRDEFRIIAPDHLGCGFSDKPQDAGYRLEDRIDHLESLVRTLDLPRFHLVLHDWGGAIGMGLAARMEERVGRILIMNTAAFPFPSMPRRIMLCRTPGIGEFAVRRLNLFAWAATRMTTAVALPDVIRKAYLYPYDSPRNRIAIWRFVRDIPTDPDHPSWNTLLAVEAGLARLQGKDLLILWGERDWCFHRGFREEWERRFPRARSIAMDDVGHYVFEDAPRRLLREARGLFRE